MITNYSVEILRSGQPRPYADTEREYRISVTSSRLDATMKPWLLGGDVEARIRYENAERAAKRLFGGQSPDELRKNQRDWAKKIVRALCQDFREKDDQDGREGMAAYFYPTLRWLRINPSAGTIHVFIIEPYTD